MIAEPWGLRGTFRAQDLTVKPHCSFTNSSIYSLIHGSLHKDRLCVSQPSAWRSSGAPASQTISQLCSSAPLTAISGDGVMDALTHWHIVFPTSAPCWHVPWLLLIIPWTLLFLKSSQTPSPISAVDAIYCMLNSSWWEKKKNQWETCAKKSLISQKNILTRHFIGLLWLSIENI